MSRSILALLILTPALPRNAKDLPWETPTSTTGRFSLDKDGEIRISSRDIVVRSELTKYPVKNIPVEDQDAPTRYKEVRKLAAQGKTAKLHGELPRYISTGLSSCTPTYSFNWSDLTGAAANLGRSLDDQRKVQSQIRARVQTRLEETSHVHSVIVVLVPGHGLQSSFLTF